MTDRLVANSAEQRRQARNHGVVLLLLSLSVWIGFYSLMLGFVRRAEFEKALGAGSTVIICALAACVVLSFKIFFDEIGTTHRNRPLGTLRLMYYCFFVGIAGYLAFWQPFTRRTLVVTLGLSTGVFALLVFLGRRLPRRLPAALWVTLDVLLLNVCLFLPAAEVGLRITGWIRPSVLFLQPDAVDKETIRRVRFAPGTRHIGFAANQGGHLDHEFVPKKPGKNLVLAIGDSFSTGIVPHYFHFTTVAERRLGNTDIYNMGMTAISPPEYLYLFITEGRPLKPDVLVINIFLGNDFIIGDPPTPGQTVLRRWFSRENLLLYQVPKRLAVLAREKRERDGETPDGLPDQTPGRLANTPGEIRESFPWVFDWRLERPTFTAERFIEIETVRARLNSDQTREEYRRRFESLSEIHRAAGKIPVLFLLIPDEYQVEDVLWEKIQQRINRPLDRYKNLRLLMQWLDTRALPYLNLQPLLRTAPPENDGSRHLYHLRNTHFNMRGNKITGEALTQFVEPYLPIPPPRPQAQGMYSNAPSELSPPEGS